MSTKKRKGIKYTYLDYQNWGYSYSLKHEGLLLNGYILYAVSNDMIFKNTYWKVLLYVEPQTSKVFGVFLSVRIEMSRFWISYKYVRIKCIN